MHHGRIQTQRYHQTTAGIVHTCWSQSRAVGKRNHIGHMPFVYFRPSKAVKASVRERVIVEQYLAYIIGFLDFQEFLFRAFVRICVRMILSSKLFMQKHDSSTFATPIRIMTYGEINLLDFCRSGVLAYSKHLVRIFCSMAWRRGVERSLLAEIKHNQHVPECYN